MKKQSSVTKKSGATKTKKSSANNNVTAKKNTVVKKTETKLKQTKTVNKAKNNLKNLLSNPHAKLKVNKSILLAGVFAVLVMLSSLFFSSTLETAFKLYPNLSAINATAMEVHFVNVGQGDAILVRLPNEQTMLVDSGPTSAKDELLFYIENVFFGKDSVKQFDYVVLTHSDSDHSGNIVTILNNYTVHNFFRPNIYSQALEQELLEPNFKTVSTQTYDGVIQKLQQLQQNNLINVIFNESGINISSADETFVTFLSPNVPTYTNLNNYSPVMLLQYNNEKIMLTGDITSLVELEIMNNYQNELLDVDVLKLAHHGSDTSTTLEFLETVKPEFAVISVGSDNSYGHPSEQVLNNIYEYGQSYGVDLTKNTLTTSEHGNVIFYINENENVNVLTIYNANSYLFFDWWLVCGVLILVVVVVVLAKGVTVKTTRASNV